MLRRDSILGALWRRRLATGLALAAAVGPSACGSSAPSRADFRQRAQAICTSALQQARVLTGPPAGSSSPASPAASARQLVSIISDELQALGRLPRPGQTPGQAEALNRYLAGLRRVRNDFAVLARAGANSGGSRTAAARDDLRALGIDALAREAGLPECAAAGTGTGTS